MRSTPTRTVLASLISMTVLSACSGGEAAEAGVPTAAAIVYDSAKAPAPEAAPAPTPAPAPVPAPVAAPVIVADPAPVPAPVVQPTPAPQAVVQKPVPAPILFAQAPPPVAMPAPLTPPAAAKPAPVPAPAKPATPPAAATPAPAPAKPVTPPAAAKPAPVPPVATPAKPVTPPVVAKPTVPPVAAPVKPVTPPVVVAPAKPVTPPAKPAPAVPPKVVTPPVVAPPKVIAPKPPVVAAPVAGLAPLPPSLPLDSAGAVTDIHVSSTATTTQSAVPLTFGQVFAAGDVASSQQLVGKLGDGTTVPLQVDVKARHPDGSARHAIISATLPKLTASQVQRMIILKGTSSHSGTAPSAAALLGAGFTAGVQLDLAGVRYSASADSLLRSDKASAWLSGPVSNEWLVSAPLTKADGTAHPHLSARFAIRTYAGTKQARVDVTIENNWAYVDGPRNFTYNANILVGGQSVYKKSALTHLHHARWRKVFWWGQEPATHIMHNVGYLIDTRALPNYDREVRVSHARLDELRTNFGTAGRDQPMAAGLATTYMPGTGGRDDIGLLPGWAATYLITMDPRAKEVTLGTADLAGSWSIHYRDKKTDKPISLHDYPYLTTLGHKGDTLNPATKQYEIFPECAAKDACTTTLAHDLSHQPSFAYLPYLLTGDHYYLEELQFWGMYDAFSSNPGYRQGISGLVKSDQVRGQAWGLRSIAQAAYITPEGDSLKKPFDSIVKANLKWYNDQYTNMAGANKLGVISHGYAIAYSNGTGLAPWMDDFFTSAIGHIAELGYSDAVPLLKWKAKFPISRMVGQDVCWVSGAMYSMKVRDTTEGELYPSIGKAWKASSPLNLLAAPCGGQVMATVLNLTVGEMTGYSKSAAGYPSNMQPALAYAADVGGTTGKTAWQKFMARTVKPNYGNGPQFAIVPR